MKPDLSALRVTSAWRSKLSLDVVLIPLQPICDLHLFLITTAECHRHSVGLMLASGRLEMVNIVV